MHGGASVACNKDTKCSESFWVHTLQALCQVGRCRSDSHLGCCVADAMIVTDQPGVTVCLSPVLELFRDRHSSVPMHVERTGRSYISVSDW